MVHGAVDPTFPLFPIACSLASVLLLAVLLTSIIRHSWNLGVAFLCSCLFFENLVYAINTIIWSNNADIKLYVYCDIVSHVQEISSIMKPTSTLLIIRRLSLIAGLRSVDLPSKREKRLDLLVEWSLGLGIPLLVAGPLYYIVQAARFQAVEGFGCMGATAPSVLSILLVEMWGIILPLFSIAVYYPRIVRMFYSHHKDLNRLLRSSNSVSRTSYIRILLLGSVDILLTLPLNATNLSLKILYSIQAKELHFYPGWHTLHASWSPEQVPFSVFQGPGGTANLATFYFEFWTTPVLAFVTFGLFGATSEARASYWRIIGVIGGWFGCNSNPRKQDERTALETIEFGERPQDLSRSTATEIGTTPIYVEREPAKARLGTENEMEGEGAFSEKKKVHEAPPVYGCSSDDVEYREADLEDKAVARAV